ncbi:hypothetical protein K6I34_007327, partial [Streptomyces sp. UNOC14_S4]|nr:hypothetical protein [Streptomyces sp. UNOC14_S4]
RCRPRPADSEYREAGPRPAALLPEVPPGPRATIGVVVGACVERGADPVARAPGVLAGAREAFADAGEFCARWADGGGELPGPEGDGFTDAVTARTGYEAEVGWFTLLQWTANRSSPRTAPPGPDTPCG